MSQKFSRLFAAIAVIGVTAGAHSAVLKFDQMPHKYELEGVGDVIFVKGFVLRYDPAVGEPYPVGFHSVGKKWRFNGRSTAVAANSCSATTTLTAEDNNPITIESMDLAALNGDPDVSVTFEGVTAEGAVVSHSISLKDVPRWQTITFPKTFRDLRYVRWTQGDCIINKPHMFDNIDVEQTWKVKTRK